jgi:LDH2 family malate/lactate/ureidoglycolate dehydrogenase
VLSGGSLVSSGGYKGYGFGLMAEILAAAFTGGSTSTQLDPLKASEGKPHDLVNATSLLTQLMSLVTYFGKSLAPYQKP